ncbi:MAG: hypothetical protein ABI914_04545 [Acidobacteriota bacterium]
MKRTGMGLVFLLAIGMLIPGTVFAQGTGVHFGLSGGGDFPVSDQSDIYKTGWNGTALLAINFGNAPIGLRIDGSYHEFKTKSALDAFFVGSGRTRVIDGTFDLVIGPRGGAVEPYFLGGVGAYDLRFRGQEINSNNAFSDNSTRFGWNAGGGIAFPMGSSNSGSRFFIEARYTSVSTNGSRFSDSVNNSGARFTFVPVNIGFLF